ncbi:hypothetical protein ACSHT0_04595 [Tepidicaulis sp. LMO-SS28]|uniref:hypothetical protein n=1 Tax=Tepidicaulis sp. LMO-SS28 TaxID=3447455 RepID=UPI003EE1391F
MTGLMIGGLLVLTGLLNALPIMGVLGAGRLRAMYGVPVEGADMLVLMQHRAVLFGIVGSFMVWAAFRPDLQPYAFAAGMVSMASFILLAWASGGGNAALQKVVWADLGGIALLTLAIALYFWAGRAS